MLTFVCIWIIIELRWISVQNPVFESAGFKKKHLISLRHNADGLIRL